MSTDTSPQGANSSDLFNALVAGAADYFFAEGDKGMEGPDVFAQDAARLINNRPHDGRALFAAGLLVAGFKISGDPPTVQPPDIAAPETVLDDQKFNENWWRVLPTIVDMGLDATTRSNPRFSEEIVGIVQRELPLS